MTWALQLGFTFGLVEAFDSMEDAVLEAGGAQETPAIEWQETLCLLQSGWCCQIQGRPDSYLGGKCR